MNKTEELYTQFRFLDPIQFSSKQKFLEYYCGMKYDLMYGWVTVGEPKYEELYDKLNCYMYRKRKEDVFKDFPKKMHMIIELEMSPEERKEYQNIEDGVREEIATGEKIITNELAIVILGRLRQYTAKLKVKHIKDIVDNLLLQNEKVVITDPYRETLSLFKEQYPEESELHTGLVDLNERNDIVKRFQTSDLKIFLGSENTTKEGLTLTASCYMFQITQSFVPAIVEQLGDRINRIGQTKPCTIYFPIFKNTIDEIVWRVVEGKKNIISKIIDGEEYKKSYNSTKIGEIVRAFFGK
jgi:SWI/SNF-related matrix-associated actin-dependent regulator 1 of chromatin subfamily A